MRLEGVNVEAISVFPYTFFYHLDVDEAAVFSSSQNNAMYEIIKENQKSFYGLATVPLQDTYEAIKEMERAITHLKMIGVEIGSNVNGKNLDDETLRPFFKRAEELGALLLVHPADVLGKERMSKYYQSVIVGNICDISLAISSIIFGGVLDEFPKLKICFSNAGGFLPYQTGRLDQVYLVRDEPKKNINEKPSRYLERIFIDTTIYDVRALRFLINTMGAENVLLGTDSPVDMHDHYIVSKVRSLEIPESDKESIFWGNIRRLLPNI
ncbi:MAG: amidohydrolase family protein [Candidatus Micrarchaeaceae archaeon]